MSRVSAALPLLLGIGLAAQAASPQVTLHENVRQVLVPVVVTDKSGHYITGLQANDFTLTEDGVPQHIVAVSTGTGAAQMLSASQSPATANPQTATTPTPVPQKPARTYLVCIDGLHSSFSNFNRVRQALEKFFSQEEPGDAQYALFLIGRSLHVLGEPTPDPARIFAALSSKNFMQTVLDSETVRTATDTQQFTYFMRDDYCNKCACEALHTADTPGCAPAQARLQAYLLRSGERTSVLDQNFYSSLQQAVTSLAAAPASRTVLLISDGFNRFPGRELYAVMNGFAPKDHRFEFNPRDTDLQLRQLLKSALQNNVRFYTVDSRGLYNLASLGGSTFDASSSSGAAVPQSVDSAAITVAHENADALAELARTTGGLFFENNNDLFRGIQRAFADGRQYYLLAYVSSNKSDNNQFRRIQVEVQGKEFRRRNVRVTAKAGYWPDASAMAN